MGASQAGILKVFLMRRVVPAVVLLVLRLLDATWRYRETGREKFDTALASGRPIAAAFLHGRLFPLLSLLTKPGNGRWLAMCSKSLDGDAMAKIEESLGCEVIRGSSGRDGLQAAVEMIRRVRADKGLSASLAVDGSRGPRGRVQGGIVALAQRTGGVILPVAVSAKPAYVFRRAWDRTVFPLPFARVEIVYGDPIEPPARLRGAELQIFTADLERRLLALYEEADRRSGFSDSEPLQAPEEEPRAGKA